MKKTVIEKTRPTFRTIEDGVEEYEIVEYITFDGKVFTDHALALAHEKKLLYYDILKLELPSVDTCGTWYKAVNESELEFLKEYLSIGHDRIFEKESLVVGEWFSYKAYSSPYNEGSNDTIYFFTAKEMKRQIDILLERLI